MQAFQAGDTTVQGYLALPQSGQGPGVLVLHAWWGLVPTFVEVCDRLAAAGFVAFAPDLYAGRTAATIAEAEAVQHDMETIDNGARMGGVAHAALAHLRDDDRRTGQAVGIVAFSMGVYYALGLSGRQPESVAAVTAFYGAGDADLSAARAAYQGHFAEHDPYMSLDEVRSLEAAIRAAGRAAEFYVYPETGHWFFEADRPDAYDADAAQVAWERTLAFLRRRLGA